MPNNAAASVGLMSLIAGYIPARLIFLAAELGIADLIGVTGGVLAHLGFKAGFVEREYGHDASPLFLALGRFFLGRGGAGAGKAVKGSVQLDGIEPGGVE